MIKTVPAATRREQLLADIERLGPWFHRIDLGDGVFTKTSSQFGEPVDHPIDTWRLVSRDLPSDLTGQSVLDVGCNGGFYAVEAKRRGAARVLGVDVGRHHVQQLQFVRDALAFDIEARRRSVYDLDPAELGRFDITLALGLLYHLKHPMVALERLFDVTKTELILESAVLDDASVPNTLRTPLGGRTSTLHTLGFVDNPNGAAEAPSNWFLPTAPAIDAMLRATGFTGVRSRGVESGRAIFVAMKPSAPAARFASRLSVETAPDRVAAGSEFRIAVRASNIGALTWPARTTFAPGQGPVHVGVHLLGSDAEETVLDWDWARGTLPSDLPSDQDAAITLVLRAPAVTGDYIAELDMVAEHCAWFADLGSRPTRFRFRVG